MYLLDTNVVSEMRKRERANPGLLVFQRQLSTEAGDVYLSVITVGELRRGIELIRYRGDLDQARVLEQWLENLLVEFEEKILDFGREEAQLWGRLRVPHYENVLDKQIAATALIYDLTLVTRNTGDFETTGVKLLNPFQ
jgi:hypothetical protein